MDKRNIEDKFYDNASLYEYLTVHGKYIILTEQTIGKVLLPQIKYCKLRFMQQLLEEKKNAWHLTKSPNTKCRNVGQSLPWRMFGTKSSIVSDYVSTCQMKKWMKVGTQIKSSSGQWHSPWYQSGLKPIPSRSSMPGLGRATTILQTRKYLWWHLLGWNDFSSLTMYGLMMMIYD